MVVVFQVHQWSCSRFISGSSKHQPPEIKFMFQTSISNFDYGFVISVQASIHWKRHLQIKKMEAFYGEYASSHHNILFLLCVTAAVTVSRHGNCVTTRNLIP